jgi:hypothetical protein
MTDQTQPEREQMARDVAFAEGARSAKVDARLDGIDDWRKTVNGSIERGAKATEKLGDKIDDLAERQRIRDAVDADRLKELKQANDRQISTRTFVIGVIAILIPLVALLLSIQGKV